MPPVPSKGGRKSVEWLRREISPVSFFSTDLRCLLVFAATRILSVEMESLRHRLSITPGPTVRATSVCKPRRVGSVI
jgi:hypothetical protein